MSKKIAHIFLDTNIFLHFQFFTEIDWIKVLQVKSVKLIIPPIVVKELDKHKYNHSSERVKDRAIKVTKKFAEILRTKAEIRPKVNIEFERIEPQNEFENYNLSKESQDDHLIASILRFQNESKNKAVLISNDVSLMIKAHQLNIEVFELPEDYQSKSEENPDKKKMKKLESELAQLKSKSPDLKIHFSNNKQILNCQMMSEDFLSDKEIEEKISTIQQEYPKIVIPSTPESLKEISPKNFIIQAEPIFTITLPSGEKRKIHPKDASKYNEEIDDYYSKFKVYLNETAKINKLRARTFLCDIKLNNIGTLPAENIDVFLYFPNIVKLVKEDNRFSLPESLKIPDFPAPYHSRRYLLGDYFNPPSTYLLPIDLLRNDFVPKIPSWEQKIIQKRDGDTVNLWVNNLKHGHSKNFESFCGIFSNPENIKSFQISFKITAANLPKQIEGKLNIVIENKKQHPK